jgi:anti-sigma-K factor RskA
MSQADDQPQDDISLIGEYALHLLDADSRLAVEQRLRNEPALREMLRHWEEGLVRLADDIAETPAPARVKARIQAKLFTDSTQQSRSPFARLSSWLGGTALLAAALAFALYFAPSFLFGPTGPTFVAEIMAEDRAVVVQALFDPVSGEINIERAAGAPADGRVFQLWLIAEGASAPVSLGVLPSSTEALLTVPADLREAMIGGTLAISDEPPGGSPTGAPTGAVVAVGPLVTSS